ncbi:MAG: fumarylacetoacetase [Acidimicrobiales bacterium]
MSSWVPVPDGSDFPLENLPYGVFGGDRRVGVAIGDHILDVTAAAAAGLVPYPELLDAPSLNPLLAAGRAVWSEVRASLVELLSADAEPRPELLIAQEGTRLHLPFEPGDYVDFYSSIEHATNLGRLFRPDDEPLLPNWRHLPVGYHGRSGTVAVSGTPVRRPAGQRKPPDATAPAFGPSNRLDIELELGFVTGGPPSALGQPVPVAEALDRLFGVVLVNDWSARDIQAWEYQPLGPFLGKSFATSVSPWVVTFDALAPYRVAAPRQDPPPLPYLAAAGDWGLDVELAVELQTAQMTAAGLPPVAVSRTNAGGLYWTMPQQLAHATSNGAIVRPGDLFATGTISGPEPGTFGSLIELTWAGRDPIDLPTGETRTFLEDGDTVILRGWGERPGLPRIGLGECRGRIQPAVQP